jgi:hypothetical protein
MVTKVVKKPMNTSKNGKFYLNKKSHMETYGIKYYKTNLFFSTTSFMSSKR